MAKSIFDQKQKPETESQRPGQKYPHNTVQEHFLSYVRIGHMLHIAQHCELSWEEDYVTLKSI